MTDQEILAAIDRGDDTVLNYLYKAVLPKVKNYILRNSGTVEDARDVFQDAVLSFYKYVKLEKYNRSNDIDGFIFSVARNLWINIAKRKQRVVELMDDQRMEATGGNLSEEVLTQEREQFIHELFEALGESCKKVLLYSIYDKLSMKEIKEKMGFTSENVAKTKNYKCKQRLAAMVKDNSFLKDYLKA
jgi:RNA polymerase sigma factor (sigma-70 family)